MIGLVRDTRAQWYKWFAKYLDNEKVEYRQISIEKDGWIDEVLPCDYIIWRPNLVDPYLTEAMEKIYFIETIMGKEIYPSLSTFWHYNRKTCQTYLMRYYNISAPDTNIYYKYDDALNYIKHCKYPIVSKSSGGAASKNVRLLQNLKEALTELHWIFGIGLTRRLICAMLKRLGLASNKYDGQKSYVYLQEMIEGNISDYRITTIGGDIAFSFRRKNRENDFRASGSGMILYDIEHDTGAIDYCLNISRTLKFDTMSYDLLFRDGKYYIVEFSYTFNDKAIFDCPGHFVQEDGHLVWMECHVWPQELIIKTLLEKWGLVQPA